MNTIVIGLKDGRELSVHANLDNVTKRETMITILQGETFSATDENGTVNGNVEDIVKIEII